MMKMNQIKIFQTATVVGATSAGDFVNALLLVTSSSNSLLGLHLGVKTLALSLPFV